MLPAAQRLTRPQDFAATIRGGSRAGRRTVVAHILFVPLADPGQLPRAGLVVSKSVGNSVTRHRVSRRLRHLLRPELGQLPPGTQVVLRALAPAAQASWEELGADVRGSLRAAVRRAGTGRQTGTSDNGSPGQRGVES